MSTSHLQTRTLTDALDRVDAVLDTRSTRLQATDERDKLARCFSRLPCPDFESWAFSASDYEECAAAVRKRAPEILHRLQKPITDRDFDIVGHSSLDLRFDIDPNGAKSVPHTLRDGTAVQGASVTARGSLRYSSGLISIPTTDARTLYLYQPDDLPQSNAAEVASSIFEMPRGKPAQKGFSVTFPRARTQNLLDHDWVNHLESDDGQYEVRNFVSSGEAILDENGFFARETQIVQVQYFSMVIGVQRVTIDGPFLAFFADDSGVHAAAWFDRDSFTRLRSRGGFLGKLREPNATSRE